MSYSTLICNAMPLVRKGGWRPLRVSSGLRSAAAPSRETCGTAAEPVDAMRIQSWRDRPTDAPGGTGMSVPLAHLIFEIMP